MERMIQNLFWIVEVFYQGVVLDLVLKHLTTFCYILLFSLILHITRDRVDISL